MKKTAHKSIFLIAFPFLFSFIFMLISCEPKVNISDPLITEEGNNGDIDGDGILDNEDTDIDGDGVSNSDEAVLFGTNPRVADTDGDGWNDGIETGIFDSDNTYLFNPKIADVPSIQLIIAEAPTIGVSYSYTDGTTKETAITESAENSTGRTVSNSNTSATSSEHGWSMDVSFGVEQQIGVKNGTTISFESSLGAHGSYTQESSYEYSTEDSATKTLGYEESRNISSSSEVSSSHGYLRTSVYIKNNGNVAYTLSALSLSAYMLNPYDDESIKMVGNLTIDNFTSATVSVGSTIGPFSCENNNLELDVVKEFANKASSLIVSISAYKAEMTANGESHDFTNTNTMVSALCSEVAVDYGPAAGYNWTESLDAEKYLIASRLNYNENYTSLDDIYYATTLDEALDILNLSYTEDTTGLYTGLSSLGGVANDPAKRAYWCVTVQEANEDEMTLYSAQFASFNLNDIEIHAGQRIAFIYSVDQDNDGLTLRIEELVGSSDQSFDTDGDGIKDFDEVRGFERNGIIYTTNPARMDTDNDGLDDNVDPNPDYRDLYDSSEIAALYVYDSSETYLLDVENGHIGENALTSNSVGSDSSDIITDTISLGTFIPVVVTAEPVRSVAVEGRGLNLDPNDEDELRWYLGDTSGKLALEIGNNEFEVIVTAEDTTTSNYTLKVAAPLAEVKNVEITGGTAFTASHSTTAASCYLPYNLKAVLNTDERVDGVVLVWATKDFIRPSDAGINIAGQIMNEKCANDPSANDQVDGSHYIYGIGEKSGGAVRFDGFPVYYYTHDYKLKAFSYTKDSNVYTYSTSGTEIVIDPPRPNKAYIYARPTKLKISQAGDEWGEGNDQVEFWLDAGLCKANGEKVATGITGWPITPGKPHESINISNVPNNSTYNLNNAKAASDEMSIGNNGCLFCLWIKSGDHDYPWDTALTNSEIDERYLYFAFSSLYDSYGYGAYASESGIELITSNDWDGGGDGYTACELNWNIIYCSTAF